MKNLGIFLLAVVVIGLIYRGNPTSPEKQRKRDAIAQCWQEYDRKSLDASTKQFVAKTCERLEAELAAMP